MQIGWVAAGVLYARFTETLSAGLGMTYAAHLQAFVDELPALKYFADARGLKNYDLLARSAFVRVVLGSRKKFVGLDLLTWSEGPSPASRALVAVLGEPCRVLTSVDEFEAGLFAAAPRAKWILSRNPKARGGELNKHR